MYVVRVCGRSENDIWVVLRGHDSGDGDPEGIAHWDGIKWWWRKRTLNLTSDLRLIGQNVFDLDIGGNLTICDYNGDCFEVQIPRYNSRCLYRSFVATTEKSIAVVGRFGEFVILHEGKWSHVDSGTNENLDFLLGDPSSCYICGTKGVLLKYDGGFCHRIDLGIEDYFMHMDRTTDGSIWIAGIRFLVQLVDENTVRHYPAPVQLGSRIAAVSPNEIYCTTSYCGLFVWDGNEFRLSLAAEHMPNQIAKIGSAIAVGCGERDASYLFLKTDDGWRKLVIDLDESFIA